ncbi:glycine betaine ABC transporter substrate-binding protein [Propionibacterium australiense]|uniref:PBP2_YehZ n=1 Tax=Propionibacterium australiense TaxID=119981 RepID=A0A383S658_9ACTN|nr:glycine betaine ABC transporter substrate-binding protein [Propionibacterium australiense]SYZ33313.1 PBP2_YehZ [Propionibacterium australiense]VEH89784.1 Osmoprotectant-binding protein [Propionibacterium australiense]
MEHVKNLAGRLRALLAVPALALAIVLSACGLGTSGGFTRTGELAGELAGIDLSGVSVKAGSKAFTEQLVLGKIAVILLRSAGADVSDLTGIPGSSSSRQALLSGQIEMLWDYSGTGWISYLGHTDPVPGEQAQYEAVRDEDLLNGLVWLPPTPANNTYGIAITQSTRKRLGITKLSDLAGLDPSELSFCLDTEFNNRNDGFEPLARTYGIDLGSSRRMLMDVGAIYSATAEGVCTFGEIFTTDGRIKSLDLVVLEDDLEFLPNYNVSMIIRQDTYAQHTEAYDRLFGAVTELLTDEELIAMNAQVDVDGREPADVAYEWLVAKGLITES